MPAWTYIKGLHELGNGSFAWLQPEGGWGWSNAGLVCDSGESLLVDTLFDLKLTQEMLAAMRRAAPAAARVGTLVNTHARFDAGMAPADAARDIALGEFGKWRDAERIAVNVHTLYREWSDGALGRANALELFAQMADLAQRGH